MEDNITVLVDAKTEYTKQLSNILVPFIFEGVKSIYDSTLTMCKINNDKSTLMRFQEQLSQIPKWNQDIINEEFERIVEDSGCDWLDELVTAVFLSHTKILTAIRSNKQNNKINLKIPKIDHFIHKCYIESAREFWKNPYLFNENVGQCDYQRNVRDCHKIIEKSIEETIRKLLPVKNILKEYLGSSYKEEEDSLLPSSYRENLRKLVKKEIEICKNGSEKNNDLNEKEIEEKIIENISDIEIDDNQSELDEVKLEEKSELNDTSSEISRLDMEEIELKEDNSNIDEEILETTNLNDLNLENTQIEDNSELEENNQSELEVNKSEVNEVENNNVENNTLEESENNTNETEVLEIQENNNSNTLEVQELNLDEFDIENKKEEIEENGELKLNINEEINKKNNTEIFEELDLNNEKESSSNQIENEEIKEVKEIISKDLYNKNLDSDDDKDMNNSNEDILNENNNEEILKENEDIVNITKENNEDKSNEIFNIKDEIKSDEKYKEISLDEKLKPVEEMEIENMKFKKVGMDSLNIDTFEDSDLELNSDNEELGIEPQQNVNEEDIEILEEIPKKTEENLNDTKNDVKTIIIDNDKNNTIKKYTKDKKKSFRFFD